MASFTRRQPCVKADGVRNGSVRILPPLPGGGVHVAITSQTKRGPVVGEYVIYPIASDFGDGFLVTKLTSAPEEDTAYQVNLSDEGHLCTCWDAAKGIGCKHIGACRTLREQRLI